MESKTPLHCPTCNNTIVWSSQYPHKPFCTHRCRLIDLGQWINEEYAIQTDEMVSSQDE